MEEEKKERGEFASVICEMIVCEIAFNRKRQKDENSMGCSPTSCLRYKNVYVQIYNTIYGYVQPKLAKKFF